MKRIHLLLFLTLLVSISVSGAGFKIGDAKYEIIAEGVDNVELKEFKKAIGDIEIPGKVTDPKKGKEYTVVSIGKEAFANSHISTVTIPSTVTSIGDGAFKKSTVAEVILPNSLQRMGKGVFRECHNLKSCNWPSELKFIPSYTFYKCNKLADFTLEQGIRLIGEYAFSYTAISDLVIPSSIRTLDMFSFSDCPDLKLLAIEDSSSTLDIGFNSFSQCPISTVYLGRNIIIQQNMLGNSNPFVKCGSLEEITIGEDFSEIPTDFLSYCTNVKNIIIENYDSDFTQKFVKYLDKNPLYAPEVKLQFTVDEIPVSLPMKEYKYKAVLNSIKALDDLYAAVTTNPDKYGYAGDQVRNIRPSDDELLKILSPFVRRNALKAAEYLQNKKEPLNDEEADACIWFSADLLYTIGKDYDIEGMRSAGWVNCRINKKPNDSIVHATEYNNILALSELALKHNPQKNVYGTALQLIALCGLGRWKEAANCYPVAHRLVTKNGTCVLPDEFNGLREMINEHGYNVTNPVYKKSTGAKKSKKSSKSSVSSDNDALVQFFAEKLVNAGVDHYKEKKRKKKARELFYELNGLDKKGRPKKK